MTIGSRPSRRACRPTPGTRSFSAHKLTGSYHRPRTSTLALSAIEWTRGTHHQQPEVNYLPRFSPLLICLERSPLRVDRSREIDLFENLDIVHIRLLVAVLELSGGLFGEAGSVLAPKLTDLHRGSRTTTLGKSVMISRPSRLGCRGTRSYPT